MSQWPAIVADSADTPATYRAAGRALLEQAFNSREPQVSQLRTAEAAVCAQLAMSAVTEIAAAALITALVPPR